jgi:hypothetical protein
MILLILLFTITLILYQSYFRESGYYPLLSIYIPMLLFLVFLVETEFSSLAYFISDEIGYWELEMSELSISKIDRLLWYSINYYLKQVDFLGVIAVKLINIPVLLLTLYMLWRLFNCDRRVFLLVLVLPYLAFIATKNLRDIIVLFLIVSTFFMLHKVKLGKILFIIPVILLFITRPFIGILCIITAAFEPLFRKYIKISFIRMKFAIHKKILIFLGIVIISFLGIKSIPYVDQRLNSYILYLNYYLLDEGYEERLELLGQYSSDNKIRNFMVGALRYISTPIPTSIGMRMLEGGSEQWGLTDDIVRTLNQLFYYFLLFYVILNFKSIYSKISLLNPGARQLLSVLFLYLPLYTFYGFGVAHQRNKLPFQIAIFLLFIVNTHFKKHKFNENRLN